MSGKQEELMPAAKRIKLNKLMQDERAAMDMHQQEMKAARHDQAASLSTRAVISVQQQDGAKDSEALETTEEKKDEWHFSFNCPVSKETTTSFCEKCLCYPCNVPATQCQKWMFSHCHARDDEMYWRAKHEENCEIQTWLKKDPVVELFDTTDVHAPNPSQERCRASPFYYPTKATFRQALRIYNMQSTRKTNTGAAIMIPKQTCTFQRKQVRGRLKSPCDDCGRHFGKHMYYFASEFDKYCLGCMGRIVAVHTSPDPSKLNHLEQLQKERIDSIEKECIKEYEAVARKQKEHVQNLCGNI